MATDSRANACCSDGDTFCDECFPAPHADSIDGLEYRTDAAELVGKVSFTREGFLRADAVVARAGVLEYPQPDGTMRREFWPPAEAKAQLDSLTLLPMTNDHPWGEKPLPLVTPANAKRLQVGHTGQAFRMDGHKVVGPVVVTDGEAIQQVKTGGRRQLSLGYLSRVVREDGVFEGQPYTHRQERVAFNHLALVAKARAGSEATLRLDGQEDRMEKKFVTVKLDGIDYEAAPEVANALAKAQAERDSARAEMTAKQDAATALQAKLDSAATELETLKKQDNAAAIREAAKKRAGLERVATRVLPQTEHVKLDGMSDDEIRRAVIMAKQPTAKLDGRDEVYVQARFDSVVEALPERDSKIPQQREQLTPRHDGTQPESADAARDRMIRDMQAAGRPKAA